MRKTFALFFLTAACQTTPAPAVKDADVDAAHSDADGATATDMADTSAAVAAGTCDALFGVPNAKTGLSATQCQPKCTCGGKDFVPPTYSDAQAAALLAWQLSDPPAQVTTDPYGVPGQRVAKPGQVCAFVRGPAATKTYSLQTFDSAAAAHAAGAQVTHADGCGVCSSVANLAVYMRHPDLTDPVRKCGFEPDKDASIACLQALGFELPCAQIWYYNTQHTRDKCLGVCLAALSAPYHQPDGTLNSCLVCDEVESGPVFKAVAGRTRRNTGLPSSMCRPCSEVVPLVHVYL